MKINRRKEQKKKRYFQNGTFLVDSIPEKPVKPFRKLIKKDSEPIKEEPKEVIYKYTDNILYSLLSDAGKLLQMYMNQGTTEISITDTESAGLMHWNLSKLEREKRILRNSGYITQCVFNEDLKAYAFLLKI